MVGNAERNTLSIYISAVLLLYKSLIFTFHRKNILRYLNTIVPFCPLHDFGHTKFSLKFNKFTASQSLDAPDEMNVFFQFFCCIFTYILPISSVSISSVEMCKDNKGTVKVLSQLLTGSLY